MKAGDQLHTFTILEVLGHGGMGGVFVGNNSENGELVAIKTLFEEFSKDEAYVRRFQREASVYRKLNHPNIVRCIASGFDKGIYFIAMEHIKGKSLDVIIKEKGALGVEHSLKIIDALAGAVYHAHSRGVVHRDIKPQNVMINEQGVVKLLDFGVAQADDDLVKTASGSIVGTFFYSSPEQNQGQRIDERSDLYSLGLVFYELLVGQRALNGATLLEVSSLQMQGRIKPPSTIDETVPPHIDKIVMRLLERNPNQRYQSARDLQSELKRYLDGAQPAGATSTSSEAIERELAARWSQAKEAFTRRDLDRALELAIEVSKAKNDDGEVHCLLGKIYAAKEYTYNAIEEFKKTMALEPGNCQYKLDFAVALFSMKMIERSKEEFEKVLEIDPNNPFAKQYLQLIEETGPNNELETLPGAQPSSPVHAPVHEQHNAPAPVAVPNEGLFVPPPVRSNAAEQSVMSGPGGFNPTHPRAHSDGGFIPPPGASPQQTGGDIPPPGQAGASVFQPSAPGIVPPPGRAKASPPLIPPPGSSGPAGTPFAPPPGGVIPPPRTTHSVNDSPSMAEQRQETSLPPVPTLQAPPPVIAPPGAAAELSQPQPPRPAVPPPAVSAPSIPPPTIGVTNFPPPANADTPGVRGEGEGSSRVASYVPPPRRPVFNAEQEEPPSPADARDAVLGRAQPRSFKLEHGEGPQGSERVSSRFQSKVRKKDTDSSDLKPPLDPATAKWIAYVWWGGGHFYTGQTQQAIWWSLVQAFLIIVMIAWPGSSFVIPEAGYWQNVTLDLGVLARLVEQAENYHVRMYVLKPLRDLAAGSLNLALRQYSQKYLDVFMLSVGLLVYLYYELKLPEQIHRYTVLSNLTGKVLEVRRDLSVKINLGEERGVQVGQIFSIQKRKHVDEVHALNFKTMMMAPKLFAIGEAKVVSTTLHFAICKFRRLPGETSNPSVGDRVMLRKSPK